MQPNTTMINAMSVDVEEYFQVTAFEPYIRREDWSRIPSRIERSCERILEIFDTAGISATFFVLGWIAEQHPELIRRIVAAGHELASHGYAHIRATEQSPTEFHADVSRTRAILEDIGGTPVRGYRAPSYSVGAGNLWALRELKRAGYRYSSSIYPIHHPSYGMPDAPRFAFHPNGSDGTLEIPAATVAIFNQRLPCGGGGYFRLMPYPVTRWALRRINEGDRQPFIFYFHPWELDPTQPRPTGLDVKTRIRHFTNLHRTENRLLRLLGEFRWDRVDRVFPDRLVRPEHLPATAETTQADGAVASRRRNHER